MREDFSREKEGQLLLGTTLNSTLDKCTAGSYTLVKSE